jgi:uncharacterized protein YdbL (DUF1318 family)
LIEREDPRSQGFKLKGEYAMADKIAKIVVLMLLVFTCSYSFAQDAKELKSRMMERIPVIKALKSKGIIGENNLGYLQFVSSGKEQEGVVDSENTDRKAVYSAIANQQGASVDLVGKRRAIQIAETAGAGEWLQDNTGKWYQKK